MYLGSKESTENEIWILNKDENKLKKEQLNYSIALYNSIDEILVNSIDHCHRTVNIKGAGKCDTIKLNFNKDTGEITVFNNGEGIPVKLVGLGEGPDDLALFDPILFVEGLVN
jgi:DNA topoisomerase-2